MKTNAFRSALAALGLLFLSSKALAFSVSLGAAGNWGVLDIGNTGTVSVTSSSITGNVGVNGGTLADNASSITGNLVTSGSGGVFLSGGATVSGTTSQNSALLSQAATAANNESTAAKGLSSSGGGTGVSSIVLNNAGTIDLNAGVYNLTNLVLNGTTLDLTAGVTYVFNISGSMALNSSKIVDLTPADVLFNITGTGGAALAGGSVLDGIVLAAKAGFSEAGGSVLGEIISGGSISVSGAKIVDTPAVPDSGSSLFLLGIAIGCLGVEYYRQRFRRSPAS
ncbi:MAG: VPDSG-CTERM sorting domain-containing protein [Verrucomicrobia bacterium]|nr:VPDSG-CTERM sorting domain-containing protein [Verrucomicrobiota bacterium]MBV8351343.1 VPDSG-CTERM sorting domain-containing protein [Verrucomicrobiota bacterium]